MTNKEFAVYILAVDVYTEKHGEIVRYGQALSNVLYDLHPKLASMLSGMPCDPFYASETNDERIAAFFEFIKESN